MKVIDKFSGEFGWLSNFSAHPIWYEHRGYKTAEHAYQAAKTDKTHEKNAIAAFPTPGQAKRAGQHVTLRPNWEEIKLDVMMIIVTRKFSQHPELAEKLIATGDAELIEGNNWGDTYWGQVDGVGRNHLGKILMAVRANLR